MATLVEAKAEVTAEHPEAVFADQVSVVGFPAVQEVAWYAIDGDSAMRGTIRVFDLGGPSESAHAVVPTKVSALRESLDAWITDYASRPWDLVVRVQFFDRTYRVALVEAITMVDGDTATKDVHAVAYVGGGFVSRKLI